MTLISFLELNSQLYTLYTVKNAMAIIKFPFWQIKPHPNKHHYNLYNRDFTLFSSLRHCLNKIKSPNTSATYLSQLEVDSQA